MNKSKLKKILNTEKELYKKQVLYSNNIFFARLKNEAPYRIWKWLRLSRYTDYYHKQITKTKGLKCFISQILYIYYIRRKQKLGERLGLEIGTEHIGKGLIIYHYNNVINGNVVIGENCHIHGTVVIGNKGNGDISCPTIGNNVMIGAGSKIIGDVFIADNIKIAAGAVVVTSFNEQGITIGGIPAHKLK